MYNTDLKMDELILSPDMKNLPMLAKYDQAVKQLISQVFAGNVILSPVERALELYILQSKESIKFPFISLFPIRGYTRINNNYSQSNIGQAIARQAPIYNPDTLKKTGANAAMQNFYQIMYFSIPYQIDCWSTNRNEALQLIQELLFWIQGQGQVLIIYKGNKYNCNMTLDENITDSSSYLEYENIGNIYRFTMSITIEAPVFRTQNYLNITKASLEVEMKEDD